MVQHEHTEVVILLMQRGNAARLLQIGTGCQNNHVRNRLTVDILVGDIVNKFRMREGARFVKCYELQAPGSHGAEGGNAVGKNRLHLKQCKGLGHVPHMGGSATASQTVTHVDASNRVAEDQFTILERQFPFIIDSDIVQTSQLDRARA